MCDLLSGWINIKTEQPEIADLRSHSRTQGRLGWKGDEVLLRREWEWTNDDDGKSLTVRTGPDDPKKLGANLRAALLARWRTRQDAIQDCIEIMARNGGSLYLSGCTGLKDCKIPKGVKKAIR